MKRATADWIEKAEGDWQVAQREMAAPNPVWDAVGFHAQQCAEKYLKAFLDEEGIPFQKTHDLVVLLDLTAGQLPALEPWRPSLGYLTPLAVVTRYPGGGADLAVAQEAIRIASEVRSALRARFGLPLV